ncbi:hypothetical protein GCM10023088_22190 [Actinomadura verrucosospora]
MAFLGKVDDARRLTAAPVQSEAEAGPTPDEGQGEGQKHARKCSARGCGSVAQSHSGLRRRRSKGRGRRGCGRSPERQETYLALDEVERIQVQGTTAQTPVQARHGAVEHPPLQDADPRAGRDAATSADAGPDGQVRGPQDAVVDRHDASARQIVGVRDATGPGGVDGLPRTRREIDAAVARAPWDCWGREGAHHPWGRRA